MFKLLTIGHAMSVVATVGVGDGDSVRSISDFISGAIVCGAILVLLREGEGGGSGGGGGGGVVVVGVVSGSRGDSGGEIDIIFSLDGVSEVESEEDI